MAPTGLVELWRAIETFRRSSAKIGQEGVNPILRELGRRGILPPLTAAETPWIWRAPDRPLCSEARATCFHSPRQSAPTTDSPADGGVALILVSLLSASGCGSFASQGMNAEGVRLFDQSRYQESIRQFRQAVFSDPNNADAYYNLASAYHRLGTVENRPADLLQAERYYNQCLDHAQTIASAIVDSPCSCRNKAARPKRFAFWRLGGPQSGIAGAQGGTGSAVRKTGDRAAAKQHLIDALKVDERNARALAALGRIREQMGETQEAMLAYQRSLTYDRFQPDVRNRLAAIQATTSPQVWAQGQPAMASPFSQQPTLAAQPTLAPQQPTLAPQAPASQPALTAQANPSPSPSAGSTSAGQTAAAAAPAATAPGATTPAVTVPSPAASSSGTQNASTDTSTRR